MVTVNTCKINVLCVCAYFLWSTYVIQVHAYTGVHAHVFRAYKSRVHLPFSLPHPWDNLTKPEALLSAQAGLPFRPSRIYWSPFSGPMVTGKHSYTQFFWWCWEFKFRPSSLQSEPSYLMTQILSAYTVIIPKDKTWLWGLLTGGWWIHAPPRPHKQSEKAQCVPTPADLWDTLWSGERGAEQHMDYTTICMERHRDGIVSKSFD